LVAEGRGVTCAGSAANEPNPEQHGPAPKPARRGIADWPLPRLMPNERRYYVSWWRTRSAVRYARCTTTASGARGKARIQGQDRAAQAAKIRSTVTGLCGHAICFACAAFRDERVEALQHAHHTADHSPCPRAVGIFLAFQSPCNGVQAGGAGRLHRAMPHHARRCRRCRGCSTLQAARKRTICLAR